MKKRIFFLISAVFLWMSCSLDEHPVANDDIAVKDVDRDRVALEALELRQMFYGSTAVKSADMGSLSVVRLNVPVKSASTYTPYVVNYPGGGYAILADDGFEVTPVVLGDGGSFDPQDLQDALNGMTGQSVVDSDTTWSEWPGDDEDVFDPEDALHGDEHIPYYPMDILPYELPTDSDNGFESGWQLGPDDDGPNPYVDDIADFFLYPESPRTDTIVTTMPGVDPQPPVPCPDSLKGKWLQMWGVKPLLRTEWHQRYPYNQYCPVINGQHALAGCAPIAAAQIGAYLAPPGKSWDWTLITGAGDEAEEAAAEFIAHAGSVMKVDYGLENSGASIWDAKRFLRKSIGCAGLSIRKCTDFDKFYSRVTDRLKHHLPVYTRGNNSNGEGHAYVIDGFVEQKKYIDDFAMKLRSLLHVNWGWKRGRGDDPYYNWNGWFLAEVLDSSDKVGDFDPDEPMWEYGSSEDTYDGAMKTLTYRVPDWR